MKERVYYTFATACLTIAILFTFLILEGVALRNELNLNIVIYAAFLYFLTFIFTLKAMKEERKMSKP